jgi:outer membrane phospholipase A
MHANSNKVKKNTLLENIALFILILLCNQKALTIEKGGVTVPETEKSTSIIQEYRPNYLIAGKPNTKIQFSFKLKLLQVDELYLGYTQTMFWELGRRSNPFSEINYNPELFYQFRMKENSYFNYIDAGYGHISNGLEEQASKSIDMLFLDFHSDEQMKKP